jgi:hypothetical protein
VIFLCYSYLIHFALKEGQVMQWHRGIAVWLVSVGILGGIVTLFVLLVVLKATVAPDPGTVAPLPGPNIDVPPELIAYEPEVRQLIETTYLGRSKEFPDPEEPAVVLEKYLEQNAHGYQQLLIEDKAKLDTELAEWEELVQLYPESRHAQVGLAKYYRTKAQVTGNIEYTRQAADAYIRAAEIGVTHGRIRYTKELADLLVELGDKKGLEEIFGRLLAQPKDRDRNFYYLALVDYADGLARLSDDRAWDYFEEAIDFHPENNEEAINLYAKHLLTRGYAQRAIELLDSLTPEQRLSAVVPAFLRKQALEQAGMDTAAAEAEIALITQRMTKEPLLGYSADNSASVPIVKALTDGRASTIFAVKPDNTILKAQIYNDSRMTDFVLFGGDGVFNGRALKVATTKWPDTATGSNRGGVAVIGTDRKVYYRYFNGTAWGGWQNLGSVAFDIAVVAYRPTTAYPHG